MDKKGMSASFLVGTIITLVAFVVIGGTIMRVMAGAEDKEAERLCHDSIGLRARTMVTMEGKLIEAEVKAVSVLCKTIDKKIKGNREEIKQQIAEKIARCWWMFGEGKYEEILHGGEVNLAPRLLGIEELKNKCFNCYTLLIDQDEIERGAIRPDELIEFMYKNNYPKLSEVTYLDYIQSYGGQGMVGFLTAGIEPRRAYTISILPVVKEEGKTNWVKWAGIGTMGAAFGGAVVCGVLTGGAGLAVCGPLLFKVLTATAVVGGKLTAAGLGYELIKGEYRPEPGVSTEEIGEYGQGIPLEKMFEEREFSSVYLSDLETGEQFCYEGDIAGK